MTASFDIATLTFNQWLLAGFIVAVSILLLGWILLCLFSKPFRNIWMTIDESPGKLPDYERVALKHLVLYVIWFGRILDLRDRLSGKTGIRIGWQHFMSVLVWIFLFAGIAGYFSGTCAPYIWGYYMVGIVAITLVYAEWVSTRVRPEVPVPEKKFRP